MRFVVCYVQSDDGMWNCFANTVGPAVFVGP